MRGLHLFTLLSMYSQTTEDVKEARVRYIETRWEGLHGLEQKRIDSLLNFLLLASSGATAAGLAYLGSVIQGGGTPNGFGIAMVASFFLSLLALGVLKFVLLFIANRVFKNWRTGYDDYISDVKSWDMLIDDDEKASRDDRLAIWIAIGSFVLLIAGVVLGYFSLKELALEKKANKESPAAISAQSCPTLCAVPCPNTKTEGKQQSATGQDVTKSPSTEG